MIVLAPEPSYKLREQWVRLWRRHRSAAVWMAANVAGFFGISFVLPTCLLFAGGLLAAQEDSWYYLIIGGLLSAGALPAGRRVWRWGHDTMLRVTGGMVQQNLPSPDEKPPRVTRMEGRAFRELRSLLSAALDLARHARQTSDVQPFRAAAERWRNGSLALAGRVSFRNVDTRIEVVSKILFAGANATTPENIETFADIAEVVLEDVDAAFQRALRRQAMGQAGAMWPNVFDGLQRQNEQSHGGEPVAFREWLVEYRRTNP